MTLAIKCHSLRTQQSINFLIVGQSISVAVKEIPALSTFLYPSATRSLHLFRNTMRLHRVRICLRQYNEQRASHSFPVFP